MRTAAERSRPPTVEAVVGQRLRRLLKEVPRAAAGDEDGVHELRVASRRLRAALLAVAADPEGGGARRLRRLLRRLERAAGGSRDLDVGLALLDERVRVAGSDALKRLRLRLVAERARRQSRLAGAIDRAGAGRLHRRVGALPLLDDSLALARAGVLIRAGVHELLADLAGLADDFDPLGLHGARRVARRLRYAAEVAEELSGQEPRASALLKTLQSELGLLNDHVVLGTWLEGEAVRALRVGREDLMHAAWTELRHQHERARCRHRAFLAHAPAVLVAHALDLLGRPA